MHMRTAKILLGVMVSLALFVASPAMASTITFDYLSGGQDTMLVSYYPNHSWGSYSVNYQWNRPGREIQTLVQFDDIIGNNPGEIPLGATITNAMLRFYSFNGSSQQRGVYQMTTGWDGTSTWNSMGGGVDVGSQTTGSAIASYTQTGSGFFGIDVTPSLQAWANGDTNYGWAILSSFGNNNDWSGFRSLNYGNVNFRPTLTVEFTTSSGVPEPGTMLLVGSALASLLGYRRRRLVKAIL